MKIELQGGLLKMKNKKFAAEISDDEKEEDSFAGAD
jgi:hypothetical protein